MAQLPFAAAASRAHFGRDPDRLGAYTAARMYQKPRRRALHPGHLLALGVDAAKLAPCRRTNRELQHLRHPRCQQMSPSRARDLRCFAATARGAAPAVA